MSIKNKTATGVLVLAGLFGGSAYGQSQDKDIQPQSTELLAFNDNAKPIPTRAEEASASGEYMALVVGKGTLETKPDSQIIAETQQFLAQQGIKVKTFVEHTEFTQNLYDVYFEGGYTHGAMLSNEFIEQLPGFIRAQKGAYEKFWLEKREKENTVGQVDVEEEAPSVLTAGLAREHN
ncbi:hypothetical protein [Marinoscillum sp.]|uniref:hypothetical protein n=1 Tax=Marinoscillum sp. TaxID=2024838 RepID=UPI003BAC1601